MKIFFALLFWLVVVLAMGFLGPATPNETLLALGISAAIAAAAVIVIAVAIILVCQAELMVRKVRDGSASAGWIRDLDKPFAEE